MADERETTNPGIDPRVYYEISRCEIGWKHSHERLSQRLAEVLAVAAKNRDRLIVLSGLDGENGRMAGLIRRVEALEADRKALIKVGLACALAAFAGGGTFQMIAKIIGGL